MYVLTLIATHNDELDNKVFAQGVGATRQLCVGQLNRALTQLEAEDGSGTGFPRLVHADQPGVFQRHMQTFIECCKGNYNADWTLHYAVHTITGVQDETEIE